VLRVRRLKRRFSILTVPGTDDALNGLPHLNCRADGAPAIGYCTLSAPPVLSGAVVHRGGLGSRAAGRSRLTGGGGAETNTLFYFCFLLFVGASPVF